MEKQIPPEQLTLPRSGGVVRFRDVEELDGIQYNKIRDAALLARKFIMPVSQMLTLAAVELIVSWDIPGMPNYPIPGSDEGQKMDSLGHLHWRDVRAIQESLFDAVNVLTANSDPTVPPTNDSSSSSEAAS